MAVAPAHTLLVLRALGLGDLLTALPALRGLADAFPRHRRVLASPKWLAPLARHTRTVHEVLPVGPLEPLGTVVRPDVAVNLHGRGPQSHRLLLATCPYRLVAFAHPALADGASTPAWRAGEHEVQRWCRLLEESGIPADPRRLDLEPPPVPPPVPVEGATVIHPGATSGARRWPVDRWAAVARAEQAAGRRVLVTGSAAEVALAVAVAEQAGLDEDAVVAGRTDVLQLAALAADAGRILCGDTGVAHLATAVGTPSVVLFGPVAPAQWGPPPERVIHLSLWTGSLGDPHGPDPDPGLLRIDVDDVLRALDALSETAAVAS